MEDNRAELIDLGVVTEETKGQGLPHVDEQGGIPSLGMSDE